MEILVDLAMKDCAARGVNLPASLKQAGRSWPIWAVRIQSQCAAGREAREETLISNIITFSPTGDTHTRTQIQTHRPPRLLQLSVQYNTNCAGSKQMTSDLEFHAVKEHFYHFFSPDDSNFVVSGSEN